MHLHRKLFFLFLLFHALELFLVYNDRLCVMLLR